MYRIFNNIEIAQNITIYAGQTNKKQQISDIDTNILTEYLKQPTTHKLIRILLNPDIDENVKKTLTCTVNGINYTSIKPYKNKKSEQLLWAILSGVDITPILTIEESKIITSYLQHKGANAKELTDMQRNDVDDRLSRLNYAFGLSTTGSKDIMWADEVAGADGFIHYNNEEIYLYLRYGTSNGGSQNDRWREMYSTASNHKENKFIFIVDGIEAMLQTNVINNCFKAGDCENGIWVTAKLLSRVDIDNFKLTKNISI